MGFQIVEKVSDFILGKSRDIIKYLLFFFFLFIICYYSLGGWPQDDSDSSLQEEVNPFQPKLPKREEEVVIEEEVEPEFLDVEVEGVIWETESPEAIIEGDVYKLGDTLKDTQAEIVDIDKEGVTVRYLEKEYKLKMKKKTLGTKGVNND